MAIPINADDLDKENLKTLSFQPSGSTRFESYAHHEPSGRLYCKFRGGVIYRYSCSTERYSAFLATESRGKFLNTLDYVRVT